MKQEEEEEEFIFEEQDYPDFSDIDSESQYDEDEEVDLEEETELENKKENLDEILQDDDFLQDILQTLPEVNFYPKGIVQFTSKDDNQSVPSLIQSLIKIPKLKQLLTNLDENNLKENNSNLLFSLKKLLDEINNEQKLKKISIDSIRNCLSECNMKVLIKEFIDKFKEEIQKNQSIKAGEEIEKLKIFESELIEECENCNIKSNKIKEIIDVNLPVDTSKILKIHFIGRKESKILNIKIMESATIKMLKESISKSLDIDSTRLIITNNSNFEIFDILHDEDKLIFIKETDTIFCYELNSSEGNLIKIDIFTSIKNNFKKIWFPILIKSEGNEINGSLNLKTTSKEIYHQILSILKFFLVKNLEKFNFELDLPSTLFPVFGGNSLFELKNEKYEKIHCENKTFTLKRFESKIPYSMNLYVNSLIFEEVYDFQRVKKFEEKLEGVLRTSILDDIILNSSNKCQKCDEKIRKKIKLFPNILILNLRRDEIQNSTIIQFNDELILNERKYQLISLMNYENSIWNSYGVAENNEWYHFKIESISKVLNFNNMISSKNSILIYQLCE
eukprot:gene8397-222_t